MYGVIIMRKWKYIIISIAIIVTSLLIVKVKNASADVKIKKTENRKKEEKKDDIPAAEHDNVAEQAGTAESDLKNSDKIENADEKRPQFQNSYEK